MHYRKYKQRTCWVRLPSRTLLSGGASCAAKQANTEGYPYKLKVNVNGTQTTANRGQRPQKIVGVRLKADTSAVRLFGVCGWFCEEYEPAGRAKLKSGNY